MSQMPAHKVLVTRILHEHLATPLAAYLQQNRIGYRIVEVGHKIGIGRRGVRHVLDAGTAAQHGDGPDPVVFGKLAQLGLGLGIGQQHLGVAHYGNGVEAARTRLVVVVVHVPLYDLISGTRDREIGRIVVQDVVLRLAVRRGYDRLLQAQVAVGKLVDERVARIPRRVGITRAVEFEVGIEELLGHRPAVAVGRRREFPRDIVQNRLLGAVLARPQYLTVVDRLRVEQSAVLRRAVGRRIDDLVSARLHDPGCGIDRRAQIILARTPLIVPCGEGLGIYIVVLAVGALPQTYARLEGQSYVAVYNAGIDIGVGIEAVFAGVIQIFEYLAHYQLALVARPVQCDHILGVDRLAVPRHAAEGLDLGPVEPCAPEASDTLVVVERRLRHARNFAHVGEEIVDVVEHIPVRYAPAGLVGRIVAVEVVARQIGACYILGVLVAVGKCRRGRSVLYQKAVGIVQQTLLVDEVLAGIDLVYHVPIEKIFARAEQHRRQSGNQVYGFFHVRSIVRM